MLKHQTQLKIVFLSKFSLKSKFVPIFNIVKKKRKTASYERFAQNVEREIEKVAYAASLN